MIFTIDILYQIYLMLFYFIPTKNWQLTDIVDLTSYHYELHPNRYCGAETWFYEIPPVSSKFMLSGAYWLQI